jgi:tetratricopeptide (TPR) repeat protein
MPRIFLLFTVCILNLSASAQFKNMLKQATVGRSNSKNNTSLNAPILENAHILPFFGEAVRSPEQIKEDELFVNSCKKNFKNKAEASEFFSTRAWDYLAEGQQDTAIHRFNLAWLLDKENVESYWGLGVIAYQRENHHDAIRFMEKGRQMSPSNVTLLVDLATVRIKCFLLNHEVENLKKASELLEKATKIAPDFADAYQKWSLLAFQEGKFDQAWMFFHKSYSLEPGSVDQNFLTELLTKQADPKGLFKK